jgi:hypothetical protein
LKKFAAILLLSVHLYSLGGYLILHSYLSYCADRFYDKQAAKGFYNVHDLEEVEVPVNLPGISDWSQYENISGQINFGDKAYNYVQMRVTRHVLYLKCIPNYKSTKLNAQNIIHTQSTKDVPVTQKDHVPYAGIVELDSFVAFDTENIAFEAPSVTLPPLNAFYFFPKTDSHIMLPEQPPWAVAC